MMCQGKNYAPGEIMPDAASFPNLKELIDWRYIGYATEDEIKAYEAKQLEDQAGKVSVEQLAEEDEQEAVKKVKPSK